MMAPELLAAYRAAHYRVEADPAFDLIPDQLSEALSALHSSHHVRGSAFITAANPASILFDSASNEARAAELEARVQNSGWVFLRGRGIDPKGEWPDEASLLILGISFKDACALAAELGQNALLWNGADAIARLILLRE